MVAIKQKVVWSDEAKKQLKEAYKYIRKDSLQNAEKIRSEIVSAAHKIPDNPERYAPDKFKLDNDGSYRAFEEYKYRIVYRVLKMKSEYYAFAIQKWSP